VCQGERWPRGRGISVITGSGGLAELILDNATAIGLDLPPLSAEERKEAESVIGRITGDGNPFDAWGNGNYAVDCDLLNPAAQNNLAAGGDNCAAATGTGPNFGNTNPNLTTVNPAILQGWGIRPYDWQFGATVQQQLMPRVSLEVSYNRRWFGNFFVTDNLLTKASDYNQWNLTVPQNPNLPGGGNTATYFDVNPAVGTGARNYQTFETDYAPARTQYWHGVDYSVNGRMRNGVTFQAGASTGRGVIDTCALMAKLPELMVVAGANQRIDSCSVTEPFLTTFRALGAYMVPKIDILVSANLRSVPNANIGMGSNSATNGSSRAATVSNLPNGTVVQSLGRLPANGLATGTTSVNMIDPAVLYGDRITQVDMRFAKVLRFGRTKTLVGVDFYNLTNSSAVLSYNQAFIAGGSWLTPTSIMSARFAKISAQFDF
jgi:hypothetical protein